MTIADLKKGDSAMITNISNEKALKVKLLDMGLIPGTKVKVHNFAPMGDPIELFLRNFILTIRKNDAEKIEVIKD